MIQITYGGILTLLDKLEIKNIIISKQIENSINFQNFIEKIESRKNNIIIAEAGKRILIEDNVYIDILWPTNNFKTSANILNNNSIIAKLNYKTSSMLLTGDIEEIAEKEVLKKYKDNPNILKSNILKVAHHGSNSSSTEEFLKTVSPEIVLIGVGTNNKFGHPHTSVLERIERMWK